MFPFIRRRRAKHSSAALDFVNVTTRGGAPCARSSARYSRRQRPAVTV